MNIQQIAEEFFITGQLHPTHMDALVSNGFRSIICNRPDDEEAGQPSFSVVEAAAKAAGLEICHVPIVFGAAGLAEINAFDDALKALPTPILGYCRSGARAASLYNAVNERTK
jgi:uncharacterized protein (TIGR01244 family)